MKKILLAAGFAAAFTPAIAQQHDHGASYQKSVFAGHEQVEALNRESHAATRAQVQQSFPGWKLTIDKVTGGFSDIYGDAIQVNGQSPLEKSQTVMASRLSKLGIVANEWKVVRDAAAPKAHYVGYEQQVNGHRVMFSKLSFRFAKDGRLVRVNNTSFGKTIKNASAALTSAAVAVSPKILEDAEGVTISSVEVGQDWVWFPVPSQNGYTLQPAWEFTAKGVEGEGMPVELNGFIDAITGELLYRSNEVKTVDLQVKANVKKTTYATPATLEPLGNIEVVMGSTTVNADDTGYVSSPAGSVNAIVRLKGRWSTVVPAGATTPADTQTIIGIGNVFVFPTADAKYGRAANAYYHTNRAHENVNTLLPGFTGMDVSLTTNTELTSGTCNAFYSGSSINFYAPSGCPSFAEIGDIVYHEYGHGINRTFYADHGANSMRNGALNEGYADVWAMTIAKDSILGRDAMGTGTNIRRYDQGHKVYPKNIVGEVHADGEIIAGAWWDVARNTGSYETMTQIFVDAFYDVADGPNGMEGPVYHKILISAILSDDNDATLSNGTPHFEEIVTAFAKHGIYLYADAKLNHQEIAHQPQNTPINVNASLTITNADFFQGLKLYFRNRSAGTWDSLWMVDNGGFNFTGQIPAQPQGAVLDYYFSIFDVLPIATTSYPENFTRDLSSANQSNIPYQFAVGVSNRLAITFEGDSDIDNWQLGISTDKATQGKWIQADPTGTTYNPNGGAFGTFVTQTDKDHTTGSGRCLVTGNGTSISNADVDGGATTVYTPVFELSSYVSPIIEYYRWFSNDRSSGSESNRRKYSWSTGIRVASGSTWTPVENTVQSDYSWRRRVFAVDQFLPGQRSIQMRFIATDNTSAPSIIEAAIDDFFIYDGVPTSVTDVAQLKASIYPNPADESVTVSLPQAVTGSIAVYDLLGKQVSTLQMDGTKKSYTIETTNLAAGQYMLLIQGDNKTIQSNKLIVTHK